MGKPSIFSKDYEQQVKKRKLNLILIILIIIFGLFFGSQYFLNKNNIKLIDSSKIKNSKIVKQIESISDKPSKSVETADNTNKITPPKTDAQKQQTPSVKETQPAAQEDKIAYNAGDGSTINLLLESSSGQKSFKGIDAGGKEINYDISKDKQMLVFEDDTSKSILLASIDGSIKDITKPQYKTRSTNKVFTKAKVLSFYKDFVWSTKPYFTSDGRVVFASQLPYIKKNSDIFLWSIDLKSMSYKSIEKLGSDPSKLSYDGFDDKGRLKVVYDASVKYLDIGSNRLKSE